METSKDSAAKKKLIIIGAGLYGLTAGVYAQKAGYDTVIYEKNKVPGGECIGWDRSGQWLMLPGKVNSCVKRLTISTLDIKINLQYRVSIYRRENESGKRTVSDFKRTDVLYFACPYGTLLRCGHYEKGAGNLARPRKRRAGNTLCTSREIRKQQNDL